MSAATTRRDSSARILNVRQAAGVSIISKPIPFDKIVVRTSLAGNTIRDPVPRRIISGFLANALSRFVMVSFVASVTSQSGSTSSLSIMKLERIICEPTVISLLVYAVTKLVDDG